MAEEPYVCAKTARGSYLVRAAVVSFLACLFLVGSIVWSWSGLPSTARGQGLLREAQWGHSEQAFSAFFGEARDLRGKGFLQPSMQGGGGVPTLVWSGSAALRHLSAVDEISRSLEDNKPHHKSLADMRQWRDILGTLIIAIACITAVSAGTGVAVSPSLRDAFSARFRRAVASQPHSPFSLCLCLSLLSGGSIFVPIMSLVMDFSPQAAAVMSQSLMCGGVLAGTLLNLCRRHPFANRPLIDLDLVSLRHIPSRNALLMLLFASARVSTTSCLVFASDDRLPPPPLLLPAMLFPHQVIFLAPAQMAGVSFGLVVNRCLPAWLLVLCLVGVLSVAVIQTIKQYCRVRRQAQSVNPAALATSKLHPAEETVDDQQSEEAFATDAEKFSSTSSLRAVSVFPNVAPADARPSTKEAAKVHKDLAVSRFPRELREKGVLGTTEKGRLNDLPTEESELRGSTADSASGKASARRVSELSSPNPRAETAQEASAPKKAGSIPNDKKLVAAGSGERRSRRRLATLRSARRRLSEMQRRHDILKWFLIAGIWIADLSLGIVRGAKGSPVQLVPYCGWSYWGVYSLSIIWLMGCSYFQGVSLYRLQRGKDEAAIRQVPGDLHFDLATVHGFYVQTFFAGLVAGTVGIGSSLVLGPLMLMKGMLPSVCTAVNTALVLCSSSAAAVNSLIGSAVPWDYCAVLFGVCFFCALFGKLFVDRMVKKHNADHLVVLFLIFIMFGSMGCMAGQSFKGPCS
ncbi:sulfite exporter protein [Cyclospora cayetanensis]|uniref:Sulfite exporter protein n=1 Tax=Cyclospora cayetanensis TaxID=88456 RepID=A0A1D3D5K5_9EIME|nr:sulfite exporter protein [Cyclospora cayetanensis]